MGPPIDYTALVHVPLVIEINIGGAAIERFIDNPRVSSCPARHQDQWAASASKQESTVFVLIR